MWIQSATPYGWSAPQDVINEVAILRIREGFARACDAVEQEMLSPSLFETATKKFISTVAKVPSWLQESFGRCD